MQKNLSFTGPDYSKVCFLFTGQGNLPKKMFADFYTTHPSYLSYLQKADSIAKKKGLNGVFEVFSNENSSWRAQTVALFASQVAIYEYLSTFSTPQMLTAHSFGEFAMLVSAGCISFEDMVSYIVDRDSSCKDNAGKMFVIFDKKRQFTDLIATINGPNQYTICSDNAGIEKELHKKKLNYREIRVPQPYHSSIMEPYNAILKKKYSLSTINPPNIPFFSSVLQTEISKKTFTKELIIQILEKQLITPINFENQISHIYKNGFFRFIEIGPREVLNSFVGEIIKSPFIKTYFYTELFPKNSKKKNILLSKDQSSFISMFNSFLKKSGFEINAISFEDSFSEDFGLDSIKKGNIVFKFLEHSKKEHLFSELNLSQIETIKDLNDLYESTSFQSSSVLTKEKDIIYCRPIKIKKEISLPTLFMHNSYFNVDSISFDDKTPYTTNKKNVLFINCFSLPKTFSSKTLSTFISDMLLPFFSHISKIAPNKTIILFGFDTPLIHSIHSFLLSLQQEVQYFHVKLVCFDSKYPISKYFPILKNEALVSDSQKVFYIQNKRHILRFEPIKKNSMKKNSYNTILCIGTGIAKTISSYFSAKKVFIIGRKSRKFSGATYISGDITDTTFCKNVLDKIIQETGGIDIIINGAGVYYNKPFSELTTEERYAELSSRMLSTQNLLENVNSSTKIIHLGSGISLTGNARQTLYAASHEFVNAISKKNLISLNLPAWENAGFTKNSSFILDVKRKGFFTIDKKEGKTLFKQSLSLLDSKKTSLLYYLDAVTFPLAFFFQTNWLIQKPFYSASLDYGLSLNANFSSLEYFKKHLFEDKPCLPLSYVLASILQFLRAINTTYLKNNSFFRLSAITFFKPIFLSEAKYVLTSSKIIYIYQKALSAKLSFSFPKFIPEKSKPSLSGFKKATATFSHTILQDKSLKFVQEVLVKDFQIYSKVSFSSFEKIRGKTMLFTNEYVFYLLESAIQLGSILHVVSYNKSGFPYSIEDVYVDIQAIDSHTVEVFAHLKGDTVDIVGFVNNTCVLFCKNILYKSEK